MRCVLDRGHQNGMVPPLLRPCRYEKLAKGVQDKEHAMSQKLNAAIDLIRIDMGNNSFHVVDQDPRGAIVLRQKSSRG